MWRHKIMKERMNFITDNLLCKGKYLNEGNLQTRNIEISIDEIELKEASMRRTCSLNCETNNIYSILGGSLLNTPFRKPSRSWEENIKLNFKETEMTMRDV
jgi:hypothetical protein